MRIDWLPFSAAALVAGATALAVGSMLMPSGDGGSAQSLELVRQHDYRWLAVAGLFFLASVAMTVGLPSILTLMDHRTSRLGLAAVGVFAVGCIGIAGYAMLLAFYRAMVLEDAVIARSVDEVTRDAGLGVFLFGWIGAFYLGELLLAFALLRAGSVPHWVPVALLVHVAALPLTAVLPDVVSKATVLLLAIAFAAMGIRANDRELVAG